MKEMDLEITSEFIVTAATLIEIKSKLLLPVSKNEEDEENKEEKDPRKELIERLVEYKKFKYIAELLRTKEEGTGIMFPKKAEIIEDLNPKNNTVPLNEVLKDLTMLDLYNIYNHLLHIYESKMNTANVIQREIPVDSFKIEDKMQELKERTCIGKKLYFSNIIKDCGSKIEVVVTFLALLELIKLKSVTVLQEKNFTEIYIEGVDVSE
jgi:segregation and condensation protein A